MLIKSTTKRGVRYRTFLSGVTPTLLFPLGALVGGLVIGKSKGALDPSVMYLLGALSLAYLCMLARVVQHGIEIGPDSLVVHSLISRTVIFREELRVADCWYDMNVGVRFEFLPAGSSQAGSDRSGLCTANLALGSSISPSDIRKLAVLIQRWWQASPAPADQDEVVRQVRVMTHFHTREEVVARDPKWSVLFDAIDGNTEDGT